MMELTVHEGKRYLTTTDGKPFFYLGDTAWELFHRLSRTEAEYYLSVRQKQGFNVIQAVGLAERDGLGTPNTYGRYPLLKTGESYDPEKPDTQGEYSYWDHVDYIVKTAGEKGLFIAFLPTWGDKYNKAWGQGPEVFTPENARTFGRWLGNRYKDSWNIIWMLGGDRFLVTDNHRAVIDAMAQGLKEGDAGNHLITFHPAGCSTSADSVKDKSYIDFHTVQSGHGVEAYRSWELIRKTGEAEEKPFMDAEPRYEDHPACFRAELGIYWQEDDIRQNTYWNLMEGVCGNTYGNHSIWIFNTEPQPYWPYRWEEVMEHPGARQARYAMDLRLSRPYFEFRPAPELVEDDPAVMAHQAAGRGEDYAFFYSPLGLPVRAYLDKLGGMILKASWFNPRNGTETAFGIVPPAETLFVPPTSGKGQDWVLIVDVMTR